MKKLRQSPTSDAFVQDPYALYSRALTDNPHQFWEEYGMLAVFDSHSIQKLLRDRRLGRARPQVLQPPDQPHLTAFDAVEKHSLLELEPPNHTRLRSLVLRAFTSRRIKALAPDIHEVCTELLTAMPKGQFDLIPAYCAPLPVRIIARLLGVPESMSPQLLAWSNDMVAMYMAGRTAETEHAANAAASAFSEFLDHYIEERRGSPRDDLITHLIAAEEDGARLTREEMISTCILLLNAGHEATVHTLGNAVKAMLEWKTPRQVLDDTHIAATIEEVLRYDPPLHIFTRYVYEDMEFGQGQLKEGAQVALVLGAAGRDPALLHGPGRFDPFRTPVAHAAFGAGLHFCLGAPLARLEMQIGLQRLFQSLPDLALAEIPRYANCYHFHGLERLVVTG